MKNTKMFLSSLVLFALCVTGCSGRTNSFQSKTSESTVSEESSISNNASSISSTSDEEHSSSLIDEGSVGEEHGSAILIPDSQSQPSSLVSSFIDSESSSSEATTSSSDASAPELSSAPSSSVLAHVHVWDTSEAEDYIEVNEEPTCTEAGRKIYRCECGETKQVTINKLGHDWNSWTEKTAATCLAGGLEERSCTRCNAKETRTTSSLGHNWDNGVITTPATEDAAGEKTFTCSRCHLTRTEVIPALPKVENVTLTDVAEANINIAFSSVADNCMVSPKVKAYVDAMEAQELTLDRPYHFSSLYGPDDYAKIAAASDKGDGTTYAAADTGGVDVCEYLSRNDYSNTAKNYPITLSWNNNGTSFSSAKLKFWSTEDKSDLREISLDANATSASLANLYRARKYRAQLVTSDGKASQGFEFTTGDYPRTITMGDIKNVRDIGGYMTSYGVRTTQGLIYRGYYIDDKSGGHGVNYNAAAGQVQEEVMKIGYELDLQSSSETNGRTQSCLSGADYKVLTLVSYENFLKESSYQKLPEVFSILANADQKHVYFHCWGGADRTGMLAFFINAICGVSYTDLIEDFEITTETNNKRCHMHNSSSAHFPKFLNAFINQWSGYDANKTINQNCEKWLLEVAGVSAANILKVRQIMIPGYTDAMEEHIPTYTPVGDWQTDNLAHWKEANEDAKVKCNWARHSGSPCSVCNASNEGGNSGSGNDNGEIAVLQRNWDANTTAKTNSDGKQYYQLTDTSNKVVGAKIAITNYTVENDASSGTAMGNDGKIGPVNDKNAILTYKITAPKVGTYQMIMKGKSSSSGAEKTLNDRNFTVKLNGQLVDIKNSRIAVTTTNGEFVAAPTLELTGNEDVIKITCSDYRIVFDTSSYIVFAEY